MLLVKVKDKNKYAIILKNDVNTLWNTLNLFKVRFKNKTQYFLKGNFNY